MPGLQYDDVVRVAKAPWCPEVKRELELLGHRTGRIAKLRSLVIAAGFDWVGTENGTTAVVPPIAMPATSDPWQSLVLCDAVREPLDLLLTEWKKSAALAKVNLTPRNRVLLHGTPGNGKSTVAKRIAAALGLSVIAPEPSDIFDSNFGESAQKAGSMLREASI